MPAVDRGLPPRGEPLAAASDELHADDDLRNSASVTGDLGPSSRLPVAVMIRTCRFVSQFDNPVRSRNPTATIVTQSTYDWR
jgi:hypothetical protein